MGTPCLFPDLAPTSSYNYGCRCPGCRDGASEAGVKARRRKRRREALDIVCCQCPEPRPGVILWFGGGYADREPRPGDNVECRSCGRPLRQFV